MTLDELQRALDHVTYRPGWKLSVYETETQGIWLAVDALVPDAYAPAKETPLRIKSQLPMPLLLTLQHFLTWLRWRLEVIETHECHEWLRWDGDAIFDPHAEGADEPRKP